MKKRVMIAIALLAFAQLARAQEVQRIVLLPLARTAYCAGDSLFVNYVVHDTTHNPLSILLEVSSDGWDHPAIIGSASPTAGRVGGPVPAGDSLYVRVEFEDSFMASDDVGPITVYPRPVIKDRIRVSGRPMDIEVGRDFYTWALGLQGRKVGVRLPHSNTTASVHWEFDESASPREVTADTAMVTFSTAGLKRGFVTETSKGGCTDTSSFFFYVLSCQPQIPAGTEIVTKPGQAGWSHSVLVKTGASYTFDQLGDTSAITRNAGPIFFVESGATLTSRSLFGIYYLAEGATLNLWDSPGGDVVAAFGVKVPDVNKYIDAFYCPNLAFDYSKLTGAVKRAEVLSARYNVRCVGDAIEVSSTEVAEFNVELYDLLGQKAMESVGQGHVTLNGKALSTGPYIVRVSNGDRVESARVVIVHR